MNQEKIFQYYQEENPAMFSGQVSRLKWMFRQAKRRYGKAYIHVLNIGIGNGWVEEWCFEQGWEVHCVDIVPETVDRMKKKGFDAHFTSIVDMPFDNASMDVVFCGEVLEHLTPEFSANGLHEISRILRPDGVLIGSTPVNEILSLTKVVCPDCGRTFHGCGHQQELRKDTQKKMLEDNGFIVKKQYVSAFLDFSTQKWYGKVAMIPFWLVGRMGRGFTTVVCGFVAKKES